MSIRDPLSLLMPMHKRFVDAAATSATIRSRASQQVAAS